MNKRYISLIIISLIAVGMLPTLLGNGETQLPVGRVFGEIEDGINQCYEIKLLQSVNNTLLPGESVTYYPPGGILDDCYYFLKISGRDLCPVCGQGWQSTYYFTVTFKDHSLASTWVTLEENNLVWRQPVEGYYNSSCNDSIDLGFPIPGNVWKGVESIQVFNQNFSQNCPIEYTWELYSICPCKNNVALYPKVDIEQFSVTGGSTIIKDGKILSSFNVVPGVQQTMIQVENRGFFTQKDARVRFMGLPEGVTVDLTPATQTIKAHNIGTYSATFTVGSNVPSGTYNIAMVAFSPNGIFDTIMIQLVVP